MINTEDSFAGLHQNSLLAIVLRSQTAIVEVLQGLKVFCLNRLMAQEIHLLNWDSIVFETSLRGSIDYASSSVNLFIPDATHPNYYSHFELNVSRHEPLQKLGEFAPQAHQPRIRWGERPAFLETKGGGRGNLKIWCVIQWILWLDEMSFLCFSVVEKSVFMLNKNS